MEQNQLAVKLTQQMVRIDSTNPGTGEKGMEQFLLSFGQELQNTNDRVTIRTEEVLPGVLRYEIRVCLCAVRISKCGGAFSGWKYGRSDLEGDWYGR